MLAVVSAGRVAQLAIFSAEMSPSVLAREAESMEESGPRLARCFLYHGFLDAFSAG